MPLFKTIEVNNNTTLAIWRVEESLQQLCDMLSGAHQVIDVISAKKSLKRQIETAAEHLLLQHVTGSYQTIQHLESGKPVIDGKYISISHTKNYVTIIISTSHQVAVDIEQRADRVGKIAKMFVRQDEMTSNINHMLLIWSAKETVYKLFSEQKLHFFDMKTEYPMGNTVKCKNLKNGQEVMVNFSLHEDFILTYATSMPELKI